MGICFLTDGYIRQLRRIHSKSCHYPEHPLSQDTTAVSSVVAALKLEDKGDTNPLTLYEST